jgi:hypothetical protein
MYSAILLIKPKVIYWVIGIPWVNGVKYKYNYSIEEPEF